MSGIRFAPSPTGRFHVGNLRTAWISHEFARALGMPWVLRFEDIDGPRVVEGAMEQQLEDMRALGLSADVFYRQTERADRHWEVFEQAYRDGKVYPCFCSRKEIQEALRNAASAPHGEPPIYNGKCREPGTASIASHSTVAWRYRGESPGGEQDFIVARTGLFWPKEGPRRDEFTPSYNWACAIDDLDGGYDILVRAWDLAPVLAQQRAIHALAGGGEAPAVFHCSLITQNDGHRLEKRTKGVTLEGLWSAGVSVEALIERFQASFDPFLLQSYPRGGVAGETARTRTLEDLGLNN